MVPKKDSKKRWEDLGGLEGIKTLTRARGLTVCLPACKAPSDISFFLRVSECFLFLLSLVFSCPLHPLLLFFFRHVQIWFISPKFVTFLNRNKHRSSLRVERWLTDKRVKLQQKNKQTTCYFFDFVQTQSKRSYLSVFRRVCGCCCCVTKSSQWTFRKQKVETENEQRSPFEHAMKA